jgi:deoxyribonuclease-4
MIGYHIPLMKNAYESLRYHYEGSKGVQAYQLFLKNPRQNRIVQLKEKESEKCREYIQEKDIFLVTHASYLLNMANPEKWDEKILNATNELDIAEQIGASGVVFHLGKHTKISKQEGENYMFEFVKRLVEHISTRHYQTKIILETSAGCGTELCSNIEDFGRFYHRFSNEELEYIKICVDTCHVFSAGYPIHTEEGCIQFMDVVENHIGWEHVLVIHLNDSLSLKGCGCKLDRHAPMMKGFIGDGMKALIRFTMDFGIPHILETPYEENRIFECHQKEIEEIQKWLI